MQYFCVFDPFEEQYCGKDDNSVEDLELLKELQLTEFEILKKIVKVCAENDIRCFFDSGTLIGAMRHKGFISWDDDIDFAMSYTDFIRFQQIAQDQLSLSFFVQNYLTEGIFYRQYAKVRNVNTTALPPTWKSRDITHGAWMDIFPVFYTDTEQQIKKAQKAAHRVMPLQRKNYLKDLFASADKIAEHHTQVYNQFERRNTSAQNAQEHAHKTYRREFFRAERISLPL